ncbi:ATP-dependent Clp protease ATP-binding subunit ClpB [Mycoplasma testudineum]|uniref:ATP-dependent Clp protease ATP-binding subunit ClpB n=1 Tax=Mycoplasma testudineum TaxID=244584 RepID=A0A4R6IH28_9MOLU|nr:AAA family ATPase [Mycoplasma testudineum]OYD27039.1 ATP-dependent chaperone ClpB [Mycoplasma testudineum]TDO21206.1 ATP-dependent Clp protease ATP-binding subunit ClpB [Mycoplasma testudineum]
MQANFTENDNRKPLEKYGRNLTALARENKLEPVINRDGEIRQMIRILSRKSKNNPVLIGDPGVGKTAIVEGLARKIVEKQVPLDLLNKELYEIDLPSLIAGASYQGQFEKRLKDLLKQIENENGRIILFIDEIHMISGMGKNSSGSGMDAANIIKPMLARGQMHLIGATTLNEFKQYIETDPAFERRMQKIIVNESTVNDTITILRGIKDRFEAFHKVKIDDEALVTAATMSDRYIADRFLPDKAIDLVDEAAASIKVEMNYEPLVIIEEKEKRASLEMEKVALRSSDADKHKNRLDEIDELLKDSQEKYKDLEKKWLKSKSNIDKLAILQDKIYETNHKIEQYYSEADYEKAAALKYNSLPKLEEETKKLEEAINNDPDQLIKNKVTREEIMIIISKWTGIPASKLAKTERDKILHLDSELRKQIKGQNEAIKEVHKIIMRNKANINDPRKPIGSFLFLGPSGVGKTEMARALAKILFASENDLIRLDMSEYMEKHSVSKLIGSPPGYIGFESGGQLTEKIRRRPYSILLIDEIEKAHPDVMNIWLQLLDNGELTDSQGRKINGKNLIVIMTSNLTSSIENINQASESQVTTELLKFLRPEFLNRIDSTVIFNKLDESTKAEIVKLELSKLAQRLSKNHYNISFDENVIYQISQRGFNEQYGARPIKRYLQDNIESMLAQKILEQDLSVDLHYIISYEAGKFVTRKSLPN